KRARAVVPGTDQRRGDRQPAAIDRPLAPRVGALAHVVECELGVAHARHLFSLFPIGSGSAYEQVAPPWVIARPRGFSHKTRRNPRSRKYSLRCAGAAAG